MSYTHFDNVEDTFTDWDGIQLPGVSTVVQDRDGPYTVFLTARCRKCEKCLRRRAREWVLRAQSEITDASRTWMGTLTLNPSSHYRYWCEASARLRRRGTAIESISAAEQLEARHLAIQPEITKMFKRLRIAGASFRYLLVLEAHASGLPHYHLLLHETGDAIRHRALVGQWKHGFSKWKLVAEGDKAAWYAAKYLSKSSNSRVRASLGYGKINQPPKRVPTPRAEGVREAPPEGEEA